MNAIRVTSGVLGVGLLLTATAAMADPYDYADFSVPDFYGRGKNTSVMERTRPDYDPVGIHAGGFTLTPKIEVGVIYTSNLYANQTNVKSAYGVFVSPTIVAQSNWGRHSLTLTANFEQLDFPSYSTENNTTWQFLADSRIDVHDESYINLGGDVERQVIPRGDTTYNNIEGRPVPFDSEGVYARGVYGVDRIRAMLEGDFRNYNFIDVPYAPNAPAHLPGPVPEGLRDMYDDRVVGRVDYALSPDYALFGSIAQGSETYTEGPSASRRSSDETRVLVGGNFDITNLARGEIGVGYEDRSYISSQFRALSGVSASSKIEYFPTQLITVTFIGQRLVEDAAFSTASGFFKNFVSLGADYEVKRNIIVNLLGSLEQDSFEGITRTDNVETIQASGKYLLNQRFGVGATLAYTNRTSSSLPIVNHIQVNGGPVYDELRFTVNLVAQR